MQLHYMHYHDICAYTHLWHHCMLPIAGDRDIEPGGIAAAAAVIPIVLVSVCACACACAIILYKRRRDSNRYDHLLVHTMTFIFVIIQDF